MVRLIKGIPVEFQQAGSTANRTEGDERRQSLTLALRSSWGRWAAIWPLPKRQSQGPFRELLPVLHSCFSRFTAEGRPSFLPPPFRVPLIISRGPERRPSHIQNRAHRANQSDQGGAHGPPDLLMTYLFFCVVLSASAWFAPKEP